MRTTVLVDVDQPERILAYYSTAPCEIAPPPGVRVWKNYPHSIPLLRMARLASDLSVRGRGFGELALLAAIEDAATISRRFAAIGGLVVDAKDERAAALLRAVRLCQDRRKWAPALHAHSGLRLPHG